MRNAGKIIVVAAVATALAACSPPHEQPSDLPPGSQPPPGETTAPQAPGTGQAGRACMADDVTVSDGSPTGPRITIPRDCAPPAELLTKDLKAGSGPGAGPNSVVELNYELVDWTDGQVKEDTFGTQATLTVRLGQQHDFSGWNDALADIQQGDQRLILVPASLGYGPNSGNPLAGQPVAIVADVLHVDAR